nr:retrotransposon protein, putative, Ty1-copia subclass [Tanacetum cinerariifolium]
RTPEDSEDDGNGEEDQGLRVSEEQRLIEEEAADELYRDVDINQVRGLQVSQDIEDSYVTLTPVKPDGQQESSSVSSFVTSMLNLISDAGVESIFMTASSLIAPIQTPTLIMTPSTIATITTSSDAPIPPTTIPSEVLQNLLTFDSVFRFKDRVKSLEVNFSKFMQTNQFTEAVSNNLGIVHQYMNQQMTEAIREAVQIQTHWLQDSFQRENDEFLRTIDKNMKRIIKEQVKSQVKEQVSRILPRIEESVNAQPEAEILTRSSHSSRTSYAVAADLTEMELKKFLIEKMEGNKSIQRSDEQRNRRGDDDDQEGPSAGSDRGSKRRREGGEPESASTPLEPATRSASRPTTGNQSRQISASESAYIKEPVQTTCQMDKPPHPVFETAVQGSAQTWIRELAKQADYRSSFNELLDTPIDFSNFIMNRLCVDILTPELLAGPTYELMRGSCTSLTELEYHLEEVYKATTDQLGWVNPEGQQYPHNLLQPLPLIPDNRGRHVIPFAHFINNDLEYLWGGASSQKYKTSVTKTKAADCGHIKWIEDLVPRTMFAVNRESALDVYSKRRIIAVTDLKIVEWHNYKHLEWISLSNLTVEERFAFNVSLRMFTRSIVIQRRMKDLQLGVESYQKRLNLTKPDTYQSDLKRCEAYTAYSNPRGFIYQNKDKKNWLMRIDELHKFSDGMLNDVHNALDDRLKGIRMQYLLQTIWRKVGFNSLVHSICALSALRRSGLRTASTATKPCQGGSSEFYLITGSIHTDQRGTVVLATVFNGSGQRHFRSFITNINLQESRRLQLLAKRTSIHNSMSTLQTHYRCQLKDLQYSFCDSDVGIDSKGFLEFFDCPGSRQCVKTQGSSGGLPANVKAQTKAKLNKKAHSAMILCLGNKVSREVTGETTAAWVWSKLETLYMTKSLANKLYLKKKLYTFYMPAGRKIFEHIDEFNKIVLDLANTEVKFEDEDLALLLLTSLLTSYKHFVDTLLYGWEALSLKDVMATLNLKEIKERSKAKEDDGKGLYVGGRTDRRDSRQSREKSRSKSRRGRLKCYICQSEDDLKRNCPKNNHKKSTGTGSARLDHRFRMFIPHDTQTRTYQRGGTIGAGKAGAVWQEKYRRFWVYILKFKREAFGKFKEWKQLVENQTERTIKKLRTDNGLEFSYPHDKQGKLEPRVVKCVLLGYPEGVKGYRLYRLDDESPKIVTSRNMVFNESVMYKDTLKDSDASDKSVDELQIEVELQRLNNRALEEDQTDQEDGDDEDAGDQATDQPLDLTDYQLEEDTHKPLTYQEAVVCEDSSKWKAAMKEEMDSLRNDKTWYKAKLVARGFTKRAGIDYNEVFSLVVRHTSIRVILALTACKDYELEQLDVKTVFLHGNLEEVIYIKQPPGYKQGNKELCTREYIYLLLYVDDVLIACKSKVEIGSTKSLLKKEFNMKELEEAKKILGMEIVRDRSRKILRVSQLGYVSKILNNFRIVNGKSVKMSLGGHFKLSLKDCPVRDCVVERMSKVSYANVVGSLMYLMVCTRPDIAYAETLQHVVALSTTKVESVALTDAVKEAIWLRGLLEELGVELNTVAVNCDNQGAIHLSRNHVSHKRTKHINVRYHFIREVLKAKTVKDLKVGTEHNAADALTKVETLKRRWRYLVPAESHIHICMLIPNYQDIKYQDFCYSDELSNLGRKEKEDNVVLRYQALKRKPQIEAQARKNMIVYLKNMAGFKMDYFKGMNYDAIRPIFKKYFNSNVAFLEKSKEQLEEEESKALKRQSESSEEKAIKKQKLDEEVEELKKHLQIVPNDDDDVYTEAALLLSSLLRNFDREDLEVLWKLLKERFASSKPKNFSANFLLTTLTYMFEKLDVEA